MAAAPESPEPKRRRCEQVLIAGHFDAEQMLGAMLARLEPAVAAAVQPQLDAVARRIDALEGPMHLSVNATPRSAAQARLANVPRPATPAEARRLTKDTLLVSRFLANTVASHMPAASEAQRRHFLRSFKPAFSFLLMNYQRRRQRERGETVPRVGQIARSQYHYTAREEDLMKAAWEELRDLRDEYWERTLGQIPSVKQEAA